MGCGGVCGVVVCGCGGVYGGVCGVGVVWGGWGWCGGVEMW
jgi:hypothetical protein